MNSIVAEKKYIAAALGVDYDSLSQSYLRSEVALGTQGKIKFNLQEGKNGSGILITEKRLALNDEFVVTHFSLSLKKIASDTPTDLQQANALLYTWENPTIFSGTNAANMASVYNGSLSWTINRKQFIPQFPVRAFRRVPTTQTGTDVGYTSSGVNTVDGFENGLFGFYPSEPTKIDGRQTIDLEVDLGTSVTFDDASNTYYAVFEARGYLIVNAKN